jgi:Fic family protein
LEYSDSVTSLDELEPDQRPQTVLHVACKHHARFIEIHPFVDGNGRTGRLCLNFFAYRYGLKPCEILVQRPPRSDYDLALTEWIL